MLQIVLQRKFFIKRPLSQEPPYVRLFFNVCTAYLPFCVKHCKIVDWILLQNNQKSIFWSWTRQFVSQQWTQKSFLIQSHHPKSLQHKINAGLIWPVTITKMCQNIVKRTKRQITKKKKHKKSIYGQLTRGRPLIVVQFQNEFSLLCRMI